METVKLLRDELLRLARQRSACAEGIAELRAVQGVQGLFDVYFDNIKYCLKHDFPGAAWIGHNVRQTALARGVLAGVKCDTLPTRAVLLGASSGAVNTVHARHHRYWVKGGSRLLVTASGGSSVTVDVFDTSEVTVDARGNARVTVFRVGGGHVTDLKGGGRLRVYDIGLDNY